MHTFFRLPSVFQNMAGAELVMEGCTRLAAAMSSRLWVMLFFFICECEPWLCWLRDEAPATRSGELAPALLLNVVLASLARGEPFRPWGEDLDEEAESSGKVIATSSSSLSMRRHEPAPENGRRYGPVGSNHEIY